MFDIVNQAMFYLLGILKSSLGSYGMAIIALTVLIRVVLWPLNTAQTKSMKKMQALQPKLKEIQAKFKDQPQKLQEAMMKLYSENSFNPLAGCLPMLLQFPIIIAMYGVLNSPEFLSQAGNEGFGFISKLHNTLQSYAGQPLDGQFNIRDNDHFMTGKQATFVLKSGATVLRNVADVNKALIVEPTPFVPGEPLNFHVPLQQLDVSPGFLERVAKITIPVINGNSRELEELAFVPKDNGKVIELVSLNVATAVGKTVFHYDVLALTVLFIGLSLLSQRVMMSANSGSQDPNQALMSKLMPLMIIIPFAFFPIPAGVLLHLVVSTALMLFQSWWVNRQEDAKSTGGGSGGSKAPVILSTKASSKNAAIARKVNDKVIEIRPEG